ncbi:acyl-CoA dehydrogenase family protein [Cryptosporangium aurantiacum]|uniref:acyl-CoA dehydrogenase family protein n=1 Tax=Cryptosporangium aurantiacum TaxID=134849 RepID=UPI00093447D4|nr:acyl-CoA dehydrogenase family protein [Cryptosporangium aurantiacum]
MDASFGIYRLAEEHGYVRDAVREIAEGAIAPYAAEVDDKPRFPAEAREALTNAGFHAVHVPKEYDGEGADAITGAIVVEEVARVCASSSLIPAVNKLGSTPVILSGSDELKREVLPPLARGEAMFSYALSEREAGSDAASMSTRAVRDGDHWVLNGTKAWITNSGVSTYYTVMAKTDPSAGSRGISAFVVHKDDPGFSVGAPERKLGIKGSPTCEIYFENCTIPLHRIVGEPGTGFATAMRTLDHTRLAIGAQAVGIAQGAFEVARDYVKQRKQFGRPIADFQSLQFMLADMALKIEAARQMVYVAAAKAERNEPDLTFYSASAKVLASDTAMSVTTDAVQLLGGAGYTKDFPVERMMRDAKITQIYEGTNQINRIVMARQLLK